jgi:hypothetical protein
VIRLDERSALDVLLRKSDLALAEPCAFRQ